ncbi:DUF2812 domain-containing protein [Sutcliffiella horikoshii]|uniref:DUF2812 domain-containing protein n=1 Tax=Sutcliffiella horikoshii TaxID=79883 RepID=UPI001CFE0D30|nr:DUF2812 domain-containing protein [Sutcliffiella horikoshii]
MKTETKPLWSYDVQKTEQWLTDQAKEGYHLKQLHRFKRRFTFEKAEPKDVTYRISYDKIKPATLSNTMRNDGWEKITQSGKWYVIANDRPQAEVTTSTSRDAIIKRNNYIFYAFMAILIYITGATLANVALITTATIASDGNVEVVESPLWIITYTGAALVAGFYMFMIYSVWKIKKTNKELSTEGQSTHLATNTRETTNVTKAEEKQLKRDGIIIKCRKFGWMYSPDKMENWLEQMASEGNRLHRVNKLGTTFYFRKGEPHHIKYSADYQNISNDSYFEIHRQAGWKDVFSSKGALQKWTIWSKEYEDGETPPTFYSDKTHKLKQAKKVALSYTMLFLPIVLMYIYIASINLSYLLKQGESWTLMNTNTAMFFLLILVFGTFITKTWMYYFRLQRA